MNSRKFELIDVTSRSVLIDDSFNLGKAEYINQTVFLDIVKYLANENDSMPFEAALTGLNFIDDMMSSDFESNLLFKVNFSNKLKIT